MRYFLTALCIALAAGGIAAMGAGAAAGGKSLDCKACHSCDKPTREEPCLLACPRHDTPAIHHPVENSPDLVVMGELSARYMPVEFEHRLHASMSAFGSGCKNCHHHLTEGRITACKSCHSLSPEEADLARPSLKGAYHRQCMGCHREWSHATKCGVCHALKNPEDRVEPGTDKTDIVEVDHPPIEEPTRVVYETDPDVGMYVTFYHDDHIEHFRMSCVSCHREEGCSRCHERVKASASAAMARAGEERDFDEAHRACLSCHEHHGCDKCHQDGQRGPFSHEASAGWPLAQYHRGVPCRECHGDDIKMQKVSGLCNGCHADWNLDNFDHGVAGLALDEAHAGMDCEFCHENRDYSLHPGCDNCHEDREYPTHLPGTMVAPQGSR